MALDANKPLTELMAKDLHDIVDYVVKANQQTALGKTAADEQEIVARIFRDAEGLIGTVTPFRVKSKDDVGRVLAAFAGAIDGGNELVVAFAFVAPGGGYKKSEIPDLELVKKP